MPSSGRFELVISRDVWERTMPLLLDGQDHLAVGTLRRNACGERTELLVDDLQPSAQAPQGERFSPLADWVAIIRPEPGRADSVADWAVRLRPRPAQLGAIVLLDADGDLGAWDGLVVQGTRIQPLAALRVVGNGMLRADRQPPPELELPAAELTRWSRTQGALGDRVWQRVRRSHVALLGASRTGSIAAFQFAALGVRRLLLCDPDTLEIHNLDAMQGVTEEDVGRTKVEALAERLVRCRSDLFVQGLACCATDARVVERVRCADLIVTCADSDTPRLAAAMLASRLLKVHLDVGTGVTSDDSGERQIAADIRLFVPGHGCVVCVGGLPDEEQARYEVLAPPGALRRAAPGPGTSSVPGPWSPSMRSPSRSPSNYGWTCWAANCRAATGAVCAGIRAAAWRSTQAPSQPTPIAWSASEFPATGIPGNKATGIPKVTRSVSEGRTAAVFSSRAFHSGVGSRFRRTINHMESGLPKNDSRPLPPTRPNHLGPRNGSSVVPVPEQWLYNKPSFGYLRRKWLRLSAFGQGE